MPGDSRTSTSQELDNSAESPVDTQRRRHGRSTAAWTVDIVGIRLNGSESYVKSCGFVSGHTVSLPGGTSRAESLGGLITIASPGKLNVFLEVLGKRADGYHELETVMLRTSLADQLTVKPTDSGQLSLRFSDATPESLRQGVPLDMRNLILRAAEAVRSRFAGTVGAEFVLHKRIPPESGLGGGSGNAAAALILCRQLWNVPLSDAELHTIAASLGSDVNFLLSGERAAVCRGRGESIEPIPLRRKLHFVAYRPHRGNSTAAVFRGVQFSQLPFSAKAIVENLSGAETGGLSRFVFNRLREPAEQLNPEMAQLMKRLQQVARRPVFMSGSGSTVFLVATSAQDAAGLRQRTAGAIGLTGWVIEC